MTWVSLNVLKTSKQEQPQKQTSTDKSISSTNNAVIYREDIVHSVTSVITKLWLRCGSLNILRRKCHWHRCWFHNEGGVLSQQFVNIIFVSLLINLSSTDARCSETYSNLFLILVKIPNFPKISSEPWENVCIMRKGCGKFSRISLWAGQNKHNFKSRTWYIDSDRGIHFRRRSTSLEILS